MLYKDIYEMSFFVVSYSIKQDIKQPPNGPNMPKSE